MLPGLHTDAATEPMGWRIANFLAIAAPYLLAAVLFAVLYLQKTAPPAHAAIAASPSSSNETESASAPAAATASMPAATRSAAPEAAKSAPATVPAATAAEKVATPAAAPSATKEESLPNGPVAVEPEVAATMKLPGDMLTYPAAARAAHIQGMVVLAATIGADGGVQSVQPLTGPALLEAGALEAVRSWRYRPWLVQGRPVPFTTQIIINFEIGAAPQ